MDEYIDHGHISQVIKDSDSEEAEEYILPHQAVIRPESTTTKLKVVFDASTTFGTILNDKLIAGPNLQGDLIDIILRLRTYEYVMMFRQILVDKRDRIYQRILWRRNPDEPVKTFELNTARLVHRT